MFSDRRHARTLAMQALCQWDVQKDDSADALGELLRSSIDASGASDGSNEGDSGESGAGIEYAKQLVDRYWASRDEIDARISAAATKWSLERISPVERKLMRVAVVEMLDGDVPVRSVLNEAIEIGRSYGGKDTPRFVNGVLDVIAKSIASAGDTPATENPPKEA